MKSLAAIGGMIEEVEVSGKKISPVVSRIQPKDVSVFSFPPLSEQFVKGTIIKWGIFETDSLPDDYISYLKTFSPHLGAVAMGQNGFDIAWA